MDWLLAVAVVLQTADAGVSCHRLQRGGREVNPLYPGASCAQLVAIKSAAFLPLPLLRGPFRTAWTVGLAIGGGVGLAVTLAAPLRGT